jgi:uncharacterized membrane protein
MTGLVILLVEKDDRFVKFHALQSSLLFGGLFIGSFILTSILSSVDILATLVNSLIWIAIIVLWAASMIKAYKGEVFKWPIVGNLAEKWVK